MVQNNDPPRKPACPKCGSGNVYVIACGDLRCRRCGYKGPKTTKEET